MCLLFFDGTIRYPSTGFESVDVFMLSADFSVGIGEQVCIHDLDHLQTRYHGQLDIAPATEPGSLRIRERIVACGPESALRQAMNLAAQLYVQTGLVVNLAESAGLKVTPR